MGEGEAEVGEEGGSEEEEEEEEEGPEEDDNEKEKDGKLKTEGIDTEPLFSFPLLCLLMVSSSLPLLSVDTPLEHVPAS